MNKEVLIHRASKTLFQENISKPKITLLFGIEVAHGKKHCCLKGNIIDLLTETGKLNTKAANPWSYSLPR